MEDPKPSPDRRSTNGSGRDEGIQVLRRAAAALDEIATEPGKLRLVDLHNRLGLAKSTARRLLVGLVEVGFATVDPDGRIGIGERLIGLTSADSAAIAATFTPVLKQVAEATDETVDLSLLRGGQMWFIDQIESAHRLRAVSAVGVRFPLHDTANGKAALAVLDDAEVAAALARLEPALAEPLTAQITAVRSTGVAFDHDEHTLGISAAGIARRTTSGNVVAISVPAPTDRFRQKQDRIVDALRQALTSPAWRT